MCVSQKLWLRVYKVIKKWGRFVYSFLEKVVLLKKAKRRSSFFHKKCRPFFLEKKSSLSKYPLQQCVGPWKLSSIWKWSFLYSNGFVVKRREREREKNINIFLTFTKSCQKLGQKSCSLSLLYIYFAVTVYNSYEHHLSRTSFSLYFAHLLSLSLSPLFHPSLSHFLHFSSMYLSLSLSHTNTHTHTHTLIFRAGFIVQICGCIIRVCLLYKCIVLHLASRKIVFHFPAMSDWGESINIQVRM